jgi:hypothetical protein
MSTSPYTFQNIEFAAQMLLEASSSHRPTMLDSIARSLTEHLLREHSGIDVDQVPILENQFVAAVRSRVDEEEARLRQAWCD